MIGIIREFPGIENFSSTPCPYLIAFKRKGKVKENRILSWCERIFLGNGRDGVLIGTSQVVSGSPGIIVKTAY